MKATDKIFCICFRPSSDQREKEAHTIPNQRLIYFDLNYAPNEDVVFVKFLVVLLQVDDVGA